MNIVRLWITLSLLLLLTGCRGWTEENYAWRDPNARVAYNVRIRNEGPKPVITAVDQHPPLNVDGGVVMTLPVGQHRLRVWNTDADERAAVDVTFDVGECKEVRINSGCKEMPVTPTLKWDTDETDAMSDDVWIINPSLPRNWYLVYLNFNGLVRMDYCLMRIDGNPAICVPWNRSLHIQPGLHHFDVDVPAYGNEPARHHQGTFNIVDNVSKLMVRDPRCGDPRAGLEYPAGVGL